MKIETTCTDGKVRYPTDINILEYSNREIDRLIQKNGKNPVSQNRRLVETKHAHVLS